MTTIHKALEQALGALEVAQRWHNGDKYRYGKPQQKEAWQAQRDELDAAITEGRKALAQTQSSNQPGKHSELGSLDNEQTPSAWGSEGKDQHGNTIEVCKPAPGAK